MIDTKQKVNKLIVINNKNNIKEYNNVNLNVEQIINNIKNNLQKEKYKKQIDTIYFKYKKKYSNIDEKIKDDKNIKNIFLKELEELLENIEKEEKELILKNTFNLIKQTNINNYDNVDFSDTNFLFINLPLMFFDITKNTLILLGGGLVNKLKQNTINKVKKELKINLMEVDENEYLQLKKELKTKQNEKIDIQQLLNENKKLKQENKELKNISKKLISEVDEIQNNFKILNSLVKETFILTNNILNTPKEKEKEKLKQELKLKQKLVNNLKLF